MKKMKFDKISQMMIRLRNPSNMSMKHYCGIIKNGRLISCVTNDYGSHAEERALNAFSLLCQRKDL